jgi:hypothetical protein
MNRKERAMRAILTLLLALAACDAQSPTCECVGAVCTCLPDGLRLSCGATCGSAIEAVMCECAANVDAGRD